MKKLNKQRCKKGFTLIEMLVVVLIIGILAGIALPQYQMAVTKAKVASILPLMRRWKDALQEYKLQHGNYDDLDYSTGGATLGVNWPSDWSNGDCGDKLGCSGDYWAECIANESSDGSVYCSHNLSENNFSISMYPSDFEDNEDYSGKITCSTEETEGHKICKALGGKLIAGDSENWGEYSLN